MRIAIDGMGGDNAPTAPVQGAVEAVKYRTAVECADIICS